MEEGTYRLRHAPVKRNPWWKFGGQDFAFVTVDQGYVTQQQANSDADLKAPSISSTESEHNVFDDADAAEIYKPMKEYEGSHRFDQSATWTPEEEAALVRRVSLKRQAKIRA